MKEEFDKYASNFDLSNEKTNLKYKHSYRVMALSEKYAKLLKFDDYDVELAGVIGLLHDIGRFEQIKEINGYDDNKKMDHADYGAYILFHDGLIERFWKNESDYNLIEFAIRNHNKLSISVCSDERVLKFAKLIRDIDKLDIIYLYCLNDFNIKEDDDDINESIIEDIMSHRIAHRVDRKNNNEIALSFDYAFDINYDIVIEELQHNFKLFYKKINTSGKFKNIFDEINNYISKRRGLVLE